MRGLLIRPAGVPVLICFEDPNPQLWDGACEAWASLEPEQIEDGIAQVIDGIRLVVLSPRSDSEVQADYARALEVSVINSRNLAWAAETLTVQVTMHLLKAYAGRKHLLHAAALASPKTGQTVALVAASGTGKTTAARFLGRHFTYLSDETAVIDVGTLRVSPYPKPLSVIEEVGQAKKQYDPAERGLTVAEPDQDFRLGYLVILDRDKAGKAALSWERVPLAEALFTLVEQSSGVQRMPQGLAQFADLVNSVGGAIRLTYSEITDTLVFFQDLLAGELDLASHQAEYTFVETGQAEVNSVSGVCYRRAPGTSGLETGEDFLVASQGKLTRTSLIGWDIWEALAHPLSADDLHAVMVTLYGPVPRPEFDRALEHLVGAGIIELVG
ncbi:hypothetical protein [Rothia sp. P4278]|uniref:hypothetical protein n=1 Tax=Rothia sp. P4278 TaxID=3402658 RepID=UPI003AE0A818